MMKPDQVDVSIIVTSYNYARFLPRAIASARAQSVPGLEIVVVDNASTDGSWDIIQNAAAEDSRIRAYRNDTNIGMVQNHNRGLELARGERVLFLSADDILLPGHLARLIAAHDQHPEIDYFYTTYFKVDENEKILEFVGHVGHLHGSSAGGRNEFADLLTYDCYMCTPTTLWNRSELLADGGFDAGLVAGDLELCLRLAARGKRFAFLDSAGVCIRVHPGEITGEHNYVSTGRQLLDHLYLLERFIVDANKQLIAGREHGIARLLNAKINNLRAYPQTASAILPKEQHRIDAIAQRLSGLLVQSRSAPSAAEASLSIILICSDDTQRAIDAIEMIERQRYANAELVLVIDSARDMGPMLWAHTGGIRTRMVAHRGALRRAVSLNDALKLANGDLIVYCDPAVRWPEGHLKRVAQTFATNQIDTLVAPVDVEAVDGASVVALYERFLGAPLAETGAPLGESIPLPAVAHRRRVIDQLGTFDERLPHGGDLEFVRRLLLRTPVGLQQNAAITLRQNIDEIHPALTDPNGYVAALEAIYASQQIDQQAQLHAAAHVDHVRRAINRAVRSVDAGGLFQFRRALRGMVSPTRTAASTGHRPRILVVDDRVPYRELGRGYPRAHDALDALKAQGDVTFYPLLSPRDEEPLCGGIPGINILYGLGTKMLASTLDDLLPSIDVLWVSRPHNMELVRKALDGVPEQRTWKLVYDAEAIYAHRDIIKAQLFGTPLNEQTQKDLIDREVALLAGADAIFAVSPGDRDEIARRCSAPVRVLSFSLEPKPAPQALEDRTGLLFVGAIEPGSPNEDALAWFVQHVAPQRPDARVLHAGVMTSQALRAAAGSVVEFCGAVPDLRDYYARARMFIAPTRFAAGLPQKVYEAAAHGLPVIATPLLARQLGWRHERELLVADSPQEWAQAIDRLNNDANLWHALRSAALEAVSRDASPAIFTERITATLAELAPHALLAEGGFQPPRV